MTTYFGLLGALIVNFSTVALADSPPDTAIFAKEDIQDCQGASGSRAMTYDARLLPDDGSVWRVGSNRWNLDWEQRYSRWVASEIDPSFFVRYNIPTDCADAAMSIRIIFSRIHHLPVMFDTGSSKITFTTKAYAAKTTVHVWTESNWKDALKADLRFREFLYKIQLDVGTSNLPNSTYPIELSSCPAPGAKPKLSKFMTEGSVLLDVHHTRFIARIDTLDRVEPIQQMNSTIPRDVRELAVGEPDLWDGAKQTGRGILKFNWAINCGGAFAHVPDKKMPGYSLQQYNIPEDANDYIVQVTPGKRGAPDKTYVDEKFALLKTKLVARMDLVNDAQKMLKATPAVFVDPASQAYDNYSTPSRDSALADFFTRMTAALGTSFELQPYYNSKLDRNVIVIGNGKYMTYDDFRHALENSLVSSDPNESLDKRWGWKIVQNQADTLISERNQLRTSLDKEIKALNAFDTFRRNYGWVELKSEARLKAVTTRLKVLKLRGAVISN